METRRRQFNLSQHRCLIVLRLCCCCNVRLLLMYLLTSPVIIHRKQNLFDRSFDDIDEKFNHVRFERRDRAMIGRRGREGGGGAGEAKELLLIVIDLNMGKLYTTKKRRN